MFKFSYKAGDPSSRQQGAVLFVALIFLLLMTIVGVTAMRNTGQEESMAGSARDHNLAFQSAEAGLKVCLALVEYPAGVTSASSSMTAVQNEGSDPGGFWTNFFANTSNTYTTGSGLQNVAN